MESQRAPVPERLLASRAWLARWLASGRPGWAAGGASLLLCGLTLALYLATLAQVHTFDALSYALDVETKPWQALFHPHHLAYGPTGALIGQVAAALGWQGRVALPLQVANALTGAVGVALFCELVRHTTRRIDLALCSGLLLGASYAYWYYAVEIEVYTLAVLWLIIALWLLVAAVRTPTVPIYLALGLTQTLAVLFHQTNLLLCVPVLVGWALTGRCWRRLLAYLLPLGGLVGAAYLFVGFGISGLGSWAEFVAWNTTYIQAGGWGGVPTRADWAADWAALGQGLTSALAHPHGPGLVLLLAGLVLLHLRRLLHQQRRLALCLASWLAIYGAFFFWWEPENAEFWIASLPPALLLLALALGSSGPRWSTATWLALAAGLTMLVGNAQAVILRGSGAYTLQRPLAQALATHSQPGDLLLVPDGLQALALHYYAGRTNTLALGQVLQTSGGVWSVACQRLRGRIEASLQSGAAVLIDAGVLRPAPPGSGPQRDVHDWRDLPAAFGLQQGQITACFAPYLPDMQPLQPGTGLPTYYRLPAAGELLAGSGWLFAHQPWGWQANNVASAVFDAGWSFVPLPDPHLVSPRLAIDTRHYWAIQLRLAKGVSNREGELLLVDAQGRVDPAQAVRWELAGHGDPKTYHLDMRTHPGWQGVVTGLRLDPTTGPDHDAGERIEVIWVRLLSYAADPPAECAGCWRLPRLTGYYRLQPDPFRAR